MSIYDTMTDNDLCGRSNWDKMPCTTRKSLTDVGALNAFRSGRTIVIHTSKQTFLFNRIAHNEAALLASLKCGNEFSIS